MRCIWDGIGCFAVDCLRWHRQDGDYNSTGYPILIGVLLSSTQFFLRELFREKTGLNYWLHCHALPYHWITKGTIVIVILFNKSWWLKFSLHGLQSLLHLFEATFVIGWQHISLLLKCWQVVVSFQACRTVKFLIMVIIISYMPTLHDNPGISRIQTESPGLPYG